MIKIDNTNVWGFEGAIRGMRAPFESWDKSDSGYQCMRTKDCIEIEKFFIGEADMTLAKKLIKGGSEHRKFLRMIHVQFDIRMPRYFATQIDTYKVGTVKNSSSTMHLITKRELSLDDFSFNDYSVFDLENTIIPILNKHIRSYNEGIIDKSIVFETIKQLLPESFMQMATYDMTYETLLNIYHQRKNHRLIEWKDFCKWCLSLPYVKDFVETLEC